MTNKNDKINSSEERLRRFEKASLEEYGLLSRGSEKSSIKDLRQPSYQEELYQIISSRVRF
jgi:hypothetical protein